MTSDSIIKRNVAKLSEVQKSYGSKRKMMIHNADAKTIVRIVRLNLSNFRGISLQDLAKAPMLVLMSPIGIMIGSLTPALLYSCSLSKQ